MLGFPVAILFANGFEWYTHKYVLHGIPERGKGRRSPVPALMKSHWTHHKEARLNEFHEGDYERDDWWKEGRARMEMVSVLRAAAVFSVAAPVAPFFTLGVWYSAANYLYVHRRSHMNPEWAREHAPWHYDHHMNSNQDANWCVTKPWFDYLMGTRVISSEDIRESNPLGIRLPKGVEKRLNRLVEKWRPGAFALIGARDA